jgi:hypothetical protein
MLVRKSCQVIPKSPEKGSKCQQLRRGLNELAEEKLTPLEEIDPGLGMK